MHRTESLARRDSLGSHTHPLPLRRAGFLDLDGLYRAWDAAPAPDPQLVVLNEPLAGELGLDVAELRSPAGVAALVGHGLGDDVVTVAQAYAGHQFGGFSPQPRRRPGAAARRARRHAPACRTTST